MKEKNVCNLNRFPIRSRMTGFTLIELVMAIALMIVVLVAGTTIFFRSFRSSAVSDIQTTVNNSVRSLSEAIESNLRYGKVMSVGTFKRSDCLSAGVIGTTLKTNDFSGGETIYSLADGDVSSTSAVGVVISNPGIEVTKLQFTWYCTSGTSDKINLLIEAKSKVTTETSAVGVSNKDINLFNSGVN